MKEDRIDILISKYLKKTCTSEEKEAVEQWKLANKSNQNRFDQVEKIEHALSGMDFIADTQTDQEWDKLQNKLGLTSNTGKEATIRRLKPFYKKYRSIAAALAALVIVGWLVYPQFSNTGIAQEYSVPKGQQKEFKLPDGSTVKLNADSYLAVVKGFSKTERRVRLQGEAYFEVAPNPEKPFIIETGDVFTQVIGTAFNLRAYPENTEIKLSVTEGKVAFKKNDADGLVLTANNAASYDKLSDTFKTEVFQKGRATVWLNGGLSFKNEPLDAIFLELERKFDLNIVNQSGLDDETYSVELERVDSAATLLNLISISFNLSYTQEGNLITISRK